MFTKGTQVEVYSGPNVRDETGNPFWYPAVVSSGPIPLNAGQQGYYVLGVGPAAYPFDQYAKNESDLRPASAARADLDERYRAFCRWAGVS
ncbi:hypothetical protein MMAG44476_21987 [Mycolicibacterium mageritense DSM 44476 = CIP 104973]|jgi:hypothetical protein|uniref:Gp45 n=1 Tax=Mycolicibacterium canariasense TaxID=228230 RepID=A0A117I9K1_MYCCR|nr:MULTISPECIES: hypothetical protein [Mycolicibacterium]MCC9179521.1 hypothetical protein [Mycolicibacterium mageritense]MCV7211474.1 hypothetical protein [Mycolicibacterium canariasense]ORV10505.1 hypothetical protein AWB94_07345 [Mycolicibacterium canariasense]GAS94864.1 Gp45 [Mycolicibacterium canariasense]